MPLIVPFDNVRRHFPWSQERVGVKRGQDRMPVSSEGRPGHCYISYDAIPPPLATKVYQGPHGNKVEKPWGSA